jgi:hypothetical protein
MQTTEKTVPVTCTFENPGDSHREICQVQQKLFDKENLAQFFEKEKIEYRFKNTFNPFFRPGAESVIDWRFDLVLKK